MADLSDGGEKDRERLQRLASGARESLPPVEKWNPPLLGRLDMRIARDGVWHYRGGPIRRESLTRLFSRILRREPDGSYCLVTPVERWEIEVEDVPFVAVDFDVVNRGGRAVFEFETNVGDRVAADEAHAVRVSLAADGTPSPYFMVRRGLEARIDRKSFIRLVDRCDHEIVGGERQFGFRSSGVWFPLAPSSTVEGERRSQ